MLVVMRPEASQDEIDAVSKVAVAAGYDTQVFETEPGKIVVSVGVASPDAIDALEGLAGVAHVAVARDQGAPETSNLRIAGIRPLVPPAILVEQLPLPAEGAQLVQRTRREVSRILRGLDDRLVVVVGPCSIHDTDAARSYAEKLAPLAKELEADLRIVMRVYFEKPRTTVGWKGLVNDPNLNGSFAVNEGLAMARQFLLDVIALGIPAGCEFLDPITPQFIADAVSWGAIGARTTESQVHRNLTSGLSMPVGFKNGTDGDVQIAVVGDGVGNDRSHEEIMGRIAWSSGGRICYQRFDEPLSMLGFAAASDVFGASLYEPCGQIDQVGNLFGATATNRDTGGYHDKIRELRMKIDGSPQDVGNGFLFRDYDPDGLWFGLEKSTRFHRIPREIREAQIKRIMREVRERYDLRNMIAEYIGLYERLNDGKPLI